MMTCVAHAFAKLSLFNAQGTAQTVARKKHIALFLSFLYFTVQFRRWKLNNWPSVIHYSLGVSFNYSLLVLLVIPISFS